MDKYPLFNANLYLSKARTGSYEASKASGGMYLYEPPHTRCVSLLLIKTLVDTLDKPKSASYSKSRETSHETALHPIYTEEFMLLATTLALRSSFSSTLLGFRS